MNDIELLREYAKNQSQEAFQELVGHHLPMVYAVAHRMVREKPLAEEVAQSVFTALAVKAGELAPRQSLGGWLYNTTRHLALHAARADQRRREREQTAAAIQALETNSPTGVERIAEHLEPAMAELENDDREALVLRYLEARTLRETGEGLGISEDAARMRVNRALERLRTVFDRRGITLTSAALVAALVSTTAVSVPVSLGTEIAATALVAAAATGASLVTPATVTTLNFMNAKIAAAILGAALLSGTGTFLVQQRQIERLRAENDNLSVQKEQLKAAENASAAAAQASLAEVEKLRKETSELLRLRNEVAQLLRQPVNRPAAAAAATPKLPEPLASGTFVSPDQLVFAGYATPEAAVQSAFWAVAKGSYDDVLRGSGPDILEAEAKNPQGREQFKKAQDQLGTAMKGYQILAKKVISENRVELKMRHFTNAPQTQNGRESAADLVQPMVKVGSEWKFGGDGAVRQAQSSWDEDGQIEVFAR